MNIIDGKARSAKCKAETAEEIKKLTADGRRGTDCGAAAQTRKNG